ncbi:DinB family protein [Paenibacillus dokdonensis]|uniref:DinB family protein n=1 Tax=Paenibacillus dokdonensis TaxID=2567944 RepID=UPI0010A8872D|nr:DinB family protein [Paenibacillus dokdonensis]
MSFEAVHPVWRAVRDRFQKLALGLREEELPLKLSGQGSSIGFMLRHNAEVEYMFAEWFFRAAQPGDVLYLTSGGAEDHQEYADHKGLLRFLEASDNHLTMAMRSLPEDAWDIPVSSPMGMSTPREALGRVMYHNGLHAGQISQIRKFNV